MTHTGELNIQCGYNDWIAAPERARSGERDFGVNWMRAGKRFGRSWRISFIDATGELYAVEQGPERCGTRYLVIAQFADEAAAERAMTGWAEAMQNLDAIVRQVRTGVPAPHWPVEPPAPEPGSGVDLSGVDLSGLEEAVTAEDRRDPAAKIYRGWEPPDGEAGDFRLVVIEQGRARPVPHTGWHGEGFGIGNEGSGAADLALTILADCLGETPAEPWDSETYQSVRHHQAFKRAFISTAQGQLRVTSDQIEAWLAEQRD